MKHLLVLILFAVVNGTTEMAPPYDLSLLQTPLQLTKRPSLEHLEALCDSDDLGCEGEDDATYTDMSLIQMEVRLSSEAPAQGHVLTAPSGASPSSHRGAHSELVVATVDTLASPIAKLSANHDGTAMLASAHKAKASASARTLAWLQIELRDSNIAIWVVILGTMGVCLVGMLLFGSRDNLFLSQDAEKAVQPHPLRPPGVAMPYGGSRLPTQQSLSQTRTPLVSSAVLPSNMSHGGSQQEVARKPNDALDLPPICPSLILPHTEARFMIQMDQLLKLKTGPVSILGTSGRKLLHALVCDSPDSRRCLMLASCGCEDDPRTCIFTPQREERSQALEVFGKTGKFYGWLEFQGRNQAVLSYSGTDGDQKPVLQIEMSNQQDLRMSASTMDGRILASAGKSVGAVSQQLEGSDAWKMQVKPGVDAVLITSCMLALILFGPGSQERLSMGGASTVGGTTPSLRPHPSPSPSARPGMFS